MIHRDKMAWDTTEEYNVTRNILKNDYTELYRNICTIPKIRQTLVLANSSIIYQWEEIKKATDLKYIIIDKQKRLDNFILDDYDIILVTPTMIKRIDFIYKYAWKRFIFDEPSSVKIPGMQTIHFGFMWLITATPGQITNLHKKTDTMLGNISKMIGWNTFESFYYPIFVKNSDEYVLQSYSMPKTHHINYKCYEKVYNFVRLYGNDRIASMVESGDIQTAIQQLGGKETDNIYDLIRKDTEKQIEEYKLCINLAVVRNTDATEWINKKNRCENNLIHIEKRIRDALVDSCPICLDNIDKPVLEPNCHNLFCGKCLLSSLHVKSTCPMCRIQVNPSKLIYINNEKMVSSGDGGKKEIEDKPVTKLDHILKIIGDKPNGKFIIFSDRDRVFHIINTVLKEKGITCSEVAGIATVRNNLINKFKSGEIQVLCLNANSNSSGINLIETTDIILYNRLSEDYQTQIIGRANRIGRKHELFVHHLLSV